MTSRRALYLSAGVIVAYWVIFAARHLLQPNRMPDSVATIAFRVCVRFIVVGGVVWVLLRANRETIGQLGFAWDGASRFLLRSGLLALGMFVVTNVVLNSVFAALFGRSETPPIAALFRDIHDLPYWIFSAIVGGGFVEELARAFTLTRFEKLLGRAGLVLALIVDSAAFGLGHLYQGPASAASSAITGLLLGLIFLRRRRVIDAIAVHALFDLLGIGAAYALYAR